MTAVPLGQLATRAWIGRVSRARRAGGIAAGVIVTLALVALAAPLIAPQDPNQVNLLSAFGGPSAAHWLGTDESGRDLFSRLIVGSRTALLGPLLVVTIAGAAGSALAIVSAWYGRWLDAGISRMLDILFAFPGILLALVVAAIFSPGLPAAVVALSLGYIPYIARVVRSEAIRQRQLPYIQACAVQGFPAWSVWLRHLLPNLFPMIVAQVTISFGYAMVDIAALSYLGLGVQPPTPDWGLMIASGQSSILRGYPEESLYAGLLIVVAVMAFTVLGDRLTAAQEESGLQ
jgi:peptide/nickel transport system permease protein